MSRSSFESVVVGAGTAPHLSMLAGCLSLSSLSPSIFFLSLLSLSSLSLLSLSSLSVLLSHSAGSSLAAARVLSVYKSASVSLALF